MGCSARGVNSHPSHLPLDPPPSILYVFEVNSAAPPRASNINRLLNGPTAFLSWPPLFVEWLSSLVSWPRSVLDSGRDAKSLTQLVMARIQLVRIAEVIANSIQSCCGPCYRRQNNNKMLCYRDRRATPAETLLTVEIRCIYTVSQKNKTLNSCP